MTNENAVGQAPAPDALLVAEMKGLLDQAEHYMISSDAERDAYLDRAAKLLHRLVDATGDEESRWIAEDAEGRAARARTTFD